MKSKELVLFDTFHLVGHSVVYRGDEATEVLQVTRGDRSSVADDPTVSAANSSQSTRGQAPFMSC